MKLRFRSFAAAATLACAGLAASSSASQSQSGSDVESFYKGRMITIEIGFPPGASYDNFARLTAANMGKYLPGHPSFMVENKPEGGPGVVRSFYETSPRDGSLIGILPQTVAIIQLTQPDIGKWDSSKFSYIGSFDDVNIAFMLRKQAPAHDIEELRKIQVNVGCNNHLGVTYIDPIVLKKLAGFPFHIICGYPGTASFPPALARGEIDLVSGDWVSWKNISATVPGQLRPVIQGGLERRKDLANVPLMQDLVSDPTSKKVIEFLSAGSAIGRTLVAPPGVPADRIEALRTAFDEMVKDPQFLAQAAKMREEINPRPGVDIQKVNAQILATPNPIVDAAIAASQ